MPTLQSEIDAKAKEIHTDGYSMSINELVSLYRDGEMDIHPEFQRFFRWSQLQKSRLIESILLGIPIPSIFVAQRTDGVWDVVDGLQRISTILEFMGELKDENGNKVTPSVLSGTRYLPSLEDKRWEPADPELEEDPDSFTNVQRLIVKRSKFDIRIIKRESDPATKYELFERLNTGGSTLSDQEVRNCLLIMVNRDFYGWLAGLAADDHFQSAIAASDRQLVEQYDLELVLRFLVIRNTATQDLQRIGDLGDFLTERMLEFAQELDYDATTQESVFRRTFALLDEALGDQTFRRYDAERDRFIGGFSVSAFEAITIGVSDYIDQWEVIERQDRIRDLVERVARLWTDDAVFKARSGTGVRAGTRIPYLVPHSREIFAP